MTRATVFLLAMAGCSRSDNWSHVTVTVRSDPGTVANEPRQFFVEFYIRARDESPMCGRSIAVLDSQEAEVDLGPIHLQGEPQTDGCRVVLRCDGGADDTLRTSLEIRELRGGKVKSSTPFLELLKDGETVTLER